MKVIKCTGACSRADAPAHEQDNLYGKGMRLHRVDEKGASIPHGCTVCGVSYRLENASLRDYPWILPPVEARK